MEHNSTQVVIYGLEMSAVCIPYVKQIWTEILNRDLPDMLFENITDSVRDNKISEGDIYGGTKRYKEHPIVMTITFFTVSIVFGIYCIDPEKRDKGNATDRG